jgi:hypothetical protein
MWDSGIKERKDRNGKRKRETKEENDMPGRK